MVPQTVAIDEALRACVLRQLVVLGAGLAARAWRLPHRKLRARWTRRTTRRACRWRV
ncbi:class I SAM-dependent methyltransferase [Streptomyces sp. NPDC048425]|uniref:class I SAM-dependent methyltransferase n=1 Tax=Streptomyces sp. NPDC048425 TaxID=3365548 RepID=UPI00371583B2